jgi:hypothetical protein
MIGAAVRRMCQTIVTQVELEHIEPQGSGGMLAAWANTIAVSGILDFPNAEPFHRGLSRVLSLIMIKIAE